MAETEKLEIESRKTGKIGTRSTREEGFVPAIIYGGEDEPLPVRISRRTLEKELDKGRFTLRQFELALNGENHHVLPRAVQSHPVSGEPLHVDFMRVTDRTRVTVEVQVEFSNEDICPGLKRGGVLSIVRHTVEVSCAVANMPEKFIADLQGLEIGDSIHVSHIEMPEGVRPTIDDRDFTIAAVAAPTVMVETAAETQVEEDEDAEKEGEAKAEAKEGEETAGKSGEDDKKENADKAAADKK